MLDDFMKKGVKIMSLGGQSRSIFFPEIRLGPSSILADFAEGYSTPLSNLFPEEN